MTFFFLGRKLLFFLILACVAQVARAGQFHEPYRSTRIMGMGGAYTAIADDESAIFLNPAGLAGNKAYVLNYITSDTQVSAEVVPFAMSLVQGLSSFSIDTLNVLLGKNVFLQEQYTATLLMPNFGFGVIADGQVGLTGANKALPRLTLGYMTTNGIQGAWGISLNKGYRSLSDFRVGIAAKMLWRRGGYHDLNFIDIMNVSPGLLSQMTGNYGKAYGVDLGAQFVRKINNRVSVSVATAYLDAGDTNFGADPMPIKGNLKAGLASTYTLGKLKGILAYDLHHIQDETDWRKKNHFGLQLSVPFLALYAGINQTYISYGGMVDFWLFRFTVASYTEEKGSLSFQNPEARYMIRLGMKFDL